MFADYLFAKTNLLPPMPACLYQYVVGANGIYVRAARPGLEAMVPVDLMGPVDVRGLAELDPYVNIQKVSRDYMMRMLTRAFHAAPKEILFYITEGGALDQPQQVQSSGGVHPVDAFASANVLIELHSHHVMDAFFSSTDDRDENTGFRIYSVIGRINQQKPSIRTRVGIYGHFFEIPSCWVYDLPPFVRDAVWPEIEEPVYVPVED